MTRLGIFGGSFDPPHNGHVEIATLATERIPLDILYFVPSYQALLKTQPPEAPARQRVAMVRLLAKMRPNWHVLTYEVDQKRPVATIETVEFLKRRHPQADCYLIIGGDQAAQFNQWQQWERLVGMVHIVCFAREGPPPISPIADQLLHVLYDVPLSSSLVRERIKAGGSTSKLLPPAVQAYIEEHRLYR
ncbi:MAG: nicotinate (nicotinamide) nucleotide adenylyltransferase [Candidatus Neomarinimicrobiota bacterium]